VPAESFALDVRPYISGPSGPSFDFRPSSKSCTAIDKLIPASAGCDDLQAAMRAKITMPALAGLLVYSRIQ